MPFCDYLQLEIPDPFPIGEFESFIAAGRSAIPSGSPMSIELMEFLRASNLVPWRFRACIEAHQAYLDSWNRLAASISFDEIYRRQQWLFSMFVNGISSIESLCYACRAACAANPSLKLTFDTVARTNAKPRTIVENLSRHMSTLNMARVIDEITNSNEWELWLKFRNTMTHRSALLPEIRASTEPLPPPSILAYPSTWSTPELRGDLTVYMTHITWLAEAIRRLLREAASTFTAAPGR